MPYFIWGPSLETGIAPIDQQHRCIVDYINHLHDAIVNGESRVVAQVLDDLIDYTMTHFAFEEELMAQAGYPHTPDHRAIHESFRERITAFKQRFDDGEDIAKKLRSGLCIWLAQHIVKEDGAYVEFVREYWDSQCAE